MNKIFSLLCAVLFFQTAAYGDTIKVTNKTPKTVYAVIYEEVKGEDPKMYGSVIAIKSDEKASVKRPDWSAIKRAKPGNNRTLYFDYGPHAQESLQKGVLPSSFVNIGSNKGDSFVIYPGYSDGDTFKPALLGQELKGTTQKDYDKNIKKEIE